MQSVSKHWLTVILDDKERVRLTAALRRILDEREVGLVDCDPTDEERVQTLLADRAILSELFAALIRYQ